jgi:hypothetical protein
LNNEALTKTGVLQELLIKTTVLISEQSFNILACCKANNFLYRNENFVIEPVEIYTI